MPHETHEHIAQLARAGKQLQALEAATAALAASALGKAERIALLDQRAEALVAEGRFSDAALDAEAMLALAGSHSALKIPALTRHAVALMRLGQNQRALGAAEQALALAEASRHPATVAGGVLCLAEAQLRSGAHVTALPNAQRAAALFEALGDTTGHGRAHWLIAFAHTRLSQNEASRRRCAASRVPGPAGGRLPWPGQCAERAQLQLQRRRRAPDRAAPGRQQLSNAPATSTAACWCWAICRSPLAIWACGTVPRGWVNSAWPWPNASGRA